MSERTPRIKRLLIFITVFLCLICGILFTQSSAGPFENSSTSVISVNTSDISAIEPGSDRDHHTDASISSGAPSPSATPSPVPTEIPETEQVSPEAENGVWTPDGTNWTEPPIPDGLPIQMLIDIISTRMGSCRPAGSP